MAEQICLHGSFRPHKKDAAMAGGIFFIPLN
jgi:hypothetical protein